MENPFGALKEREHATRFACPRTTTLERNIAELLRRQVGRPTYGPVELSVSGGQLEAAVASSANINLQY